MMGRQAGDQSQLFYLFNLERRFQRAIFALDQSGGDTDSWRSFVRACAFL